MVTRRRERDGILHYLDITTLLYLPRWVGLRPCLIDNYVWVALPLGLGPTFMCWGERARKIEKGVGMWSMPVFHAEESFVFSPWSPHMT